MKKSILCFVLLFVFAFVFTSCMQPKTEITVDKDGYLIVNGEKTIEGDIFVEFSVKN